MLSASVAKRDEYAGLPLEAGHDRPVDFVCPVAALIFSVDGGHVSPLIAPGSCHCGRKCQQASERRYEWCRSIQLMRLCCRKFIQKEDENGYDNFDDSRRSWGSGNRDEILPPGISEGRKGRDRNDTCRVLPSNTLPFVRVEVTLNDVAPTSFWTIENQTDDPARIDRGRTTVNRPRALSI